MAAPEQSAPSAVAGRTAAERKPGALHNTSGETSKIPTAAQFLVLVKSIGLHRSRKIGSETNRSVRQSLITVIF